MNNMFIYWIIFLSSCISSFIYSDIFEHICEFPFNIEKSCKPCKPRRGPPGPRGPQGIHGSTGASGTGGIAIGPTGATELQGLEVTLVLLVQQEHVG